MGPGRFGGATGFFVTLIGYFRLGKTVKVNDCPTGARNKRKASVKIR